MLRWVKTALLKTRLILHMVHLASLSILYLGAFILILASLSTQRHYRGNCQLGLYCDSGSKLCMTSKLLGAACAADKEYTVLSMSIVQTSINSCDVT